MWNDPAANGRNLVSHVLPPLAVALMLLLPATAQAALSPAGAKLPGAVGWQAGQAVAISADGTLGLAGAPGNGSVRVLARSGGTWADTGAPLVPAAGPDAAGFGGAVALSADGTVALVGAVDADAGYGAAWLFVRSGTTWTQAARLTGAGEDGAGQFGSSVALSADGSVAVVGAPLDGDGVGAAWVFVRSGGAWTQRGGKLVGIGETGAATFGSAVAVSGDGGTVVVGGPADNGNAGAVWAFARNGGGMYVQDGAKLVVAGSAGLGYAVGSDLTGAAVLAGAPADGIGAAYVFVRSGSAFIQQAKLTAAGIGSPRLGSSVALSADGNVALLGAPTDSTTKGAAWVFDRSGSTWTRREQLLPAGGVSARFGTSVALAADGHAALAGGPLDATTKGAVWAFAEAPTITAVAPALGPSAGGTAVTVTGTGLGAAGTVRFGGVPASAVLVTSPTQLTAVAPPGAIGTVHVTVETSAGTSSATDADAFSYADVPGAPAAVTATAGDGEATVAFELPAADGGRPVEGYVVTVEPGGRTVDVTSSPVTVTGLANGTPVTFTVRARNAIGLGSASAATAPVTPAAPITPAPVVAGVSTQLGAAGTVVIITGSHLTGAATVRFGDVPAAFAVETDAEITATAPVRPPGQVHVTVTTPGGTSTTSCADAFAYLPADGALPGHRCAVAYPLRSTGTGRAAHAVAVSIPADGTATLLDAAGTATADLQTAQGRYALDVAHALVTFVPARGFAGHAAGVRYRVHGDDDTEATGTYTPEVTLPPAPTARALATSGAGGALQRVAVPAAAGTAVALLDAGGAAAATVLVSGEGRYDVAAGTITFRPAAGFAGRGQGVRFRLTDEYGQTAEAAYLPTVVAAPTPAAPRVRLTTAPLVVASPEGEVTLGCGVTAGTLATCRIALVADAAGRDVTVGSGTVAGEGHADVLVTVRLTALGRDLSRQPGGAAVRAEARVTVAGRAGSLAGATGIHAVARSFVLRHAVRFGRGAAVLRASERRYLDALAGALAGARRVTCIGAARDVRGPRRTRLARARAAATCAFLRARLPRGTALASRAQRPAEHRGSAARVDLVLRY